MSGRQCQRQNKAAQQRTEVIPVYAFSLPPSASNRSELNNPPLSVHTRAHLLCRVRLCDPHGLRQAVARQGPLSTGFSRQEYWSGLPFPPPGCPCDPSSPAGNTQKVPRCSTARDRTEQRPLGKEAGLQRAGWSESLARRRETGSRARLCSPFQPNLQTERPGGGEAVDGQEEERAGVC